MLGQTWQYNGYWYHLEGDLDDLGIWNRALTGSEIQQLYSGGDNSTYTWSTGETSSSIWVSPSQTTTYSVTLDDGNGACTDDVEIEVNQTTSYTDITACESYEWNGTTYDSSGTYSYDGLSNNLTNANGCDSTAVLNLIINSSSASTAEVTECDSYSWNGTEYLASGVYTFETLNTNGCDSIATLDLTINASSASTTEVTECDSYSWNGTDYNASGVYTFETLNTNGCDSIATLDLTINASSASTTEVD